MKTSLILYIDRFKDRSPTDESIFWVRKKPKEIAEGFNAEFQECVSNGSLERLLKELGYGYRKPFKQLATGSYQNRNLQFEIITILILAMGI